MVLFNLPTNHQQVLLLQHRNNMMEHHLQLHYQPSPTSPVLRRSSQESSDQDCRQRRIQCVYVTDAKPASGFNLAVHNTETAAFCNSSTNLPIKLNGTSRGSNVSSCGTASSSSPTGSGATGTPSPAQAGSTNVFPQQQQHTSFMISDILDSSNTRSNSSSSIRSTSCSGSSVRTVLDEGRSSYCEDLSNGRDSPRSNFSDDVDCKEERDKREDSLGTSDSDNERPNQGV